jgi:hypothetical protein
MSAYAGSGNAEYDGLPESIKQAYSLKEWLWLSDEMKASLVGTMTTPEWDE